jgi:hypothetical protein
MSIATAAPTDPKPTASSKFSLWLLGIGLFALLGSAALAARLIWEMTMWTWERGPQNIGFMLVHGSGAILVLFPPVLILWLAVAIAYTLWRLLKRRPLSRSSVITMVLSVGLLWVLSLPYGFWQRLFIDRLISGPKAAKLFVYAASLDDLDAVKTFLAYGIPVDIRDRGKTALNGAAAGGKTEVVKYLIAAGADENATGYLGRVTPGSRDCREAPRSCILPLGTRSQNHPRNRGAARKSPAGFFWRPFPTLSQKGRPPARADSTQNDDQ